MPVFSSRLVVLLAPAVSVVGGLGIVKAFRWALYRIQNPYPAEDGAAFDDAKRAQFTMQAAEKKLTNLLDNSLNAEGKLCFLGFVFGLVQIKHASLFNLCQMAAFASHSSNAVHPFHSVHGTTAI